LAVPPTEGEPVAATRQVGVPVSMTLIGRSTGAPLMITRSRRLESTASGPAIEQWGPTIERWEPASQRVRSSSRRRPRPRRRRPRRRQSCELVAWALTDACVVPARIAVTALSPLCSGTRLSPAQCDSSPSLVRGLSGGMCVAACKTQRSEFIRRYVRHAPHSPFTGSLRYSWAPMPRAAWFGPKASAGRG
jgi:hypothetical protein